MNSQKLSLIERLERIANEARVEGYAVTYWSPDELDLFPGASVDDLLDIAVERGNDYLSQFEVFADE